MMSLRIAYPLACIAFAALTLSPLKCIAQDDTHTITARDLATLRDISGLNVSTDGRWAAFSIAQADAGRNRYDIAWYVFDIAEGNARRLADGGELSPSNFGGKTSEYLPPQVSAWSADSLWIAYLRRDNGSTQIWRAQRDGSDANQVTHNDADVRALVYTPDSARILFQTQPSQRQVAQDLATEARTGFLYDERFIPFYSLQPVAPRDLDLQRLTAPTKSEIEARQVWAVELASGRERPATEAERTEYAALTASIQPTPRARSDCSAVHDKLLCLYERPNYPRRLVAMNPDSGAVKTLYDPNPDFARFDLGSPPQRLAIRAQSGAETYGYLVLPPQYRAGKRLPLVIVTYRCKGFLRGGTGDEYPIYPFAAQGFAVLCFNLPEDLDRMTRMDSVSYTKWERGPGAPMRRRINDTLDAAIAQLDRKGLIDPDRVGITGLSYGAEIVFVTLPHMPRLAAAIASSGGPGPAQYPYQGRAARKRFRSFGLGAPDETPERWREHSFSPHVERVRAPLLINVADREFLGSLDTVTALEDAGSAVEMHVFPDEYHVKWQPAHRLAIYNRNIGWMNFWLRGVESAMTGDASQYERWQAMRQNQCRLFGPEGTELSSRSKRREGLTDNDLIPWYCRPGAATAL